MAFKAKIKETEELIDIEILDAPRVKFGKTDFTCAFPDCDCTMRVVSSSQRSRAHFRTIGSSCRTAWAHNNESPEHLQAKELLIDYFKTLPDYKEATYDKEYYGLEEIRRIPDILVTYENGYREAQEIQFSYQTIDEYIRRSNDYNKIGVGVIWYLGPTAIRDNISRQLRINGIEYRGIKIEVEGDETWHVMNTSHAL